MRMNRKTSRISSAIAELSCLLNRLKLHGMQQKPSHCIHGVRRAGEYFDYRIDDLTRLHLTDYFVHIVNSLSWSSVKHDLYGLKFYYAQVLNKPWPGADLVKPPKSTHCGYYYRATAQQIFMATRALSSACFSSPVQPGITAGRRLALQIGDMSGPDAGARRNAKAIGRFARCRSTFSMRRSGRPPQPRIALP